MGIAEGIFCYTHEVDPDVKFFRWGKWGNLVEKFVREYGILAGLAELPSMRSNVVIKYGQ